MDLVKQEVKGWRRELEEVQKVEFPELQVQTGHCIITQDNIMDFPRLLPVNPREILKI